MFKQYEQFNILAIKCFALEHLSVLAKDCFSKRPFWHFGHFLQKCFGDSLLARARQHVFQQSSVLAKQCFSKGVLASFSKFSQVLAREFKQMFQQEIVLAFGCFSTGFLAQILLAFGCFSKLVFQHKGFSAYECFSIRVYQLRCLFSNYQCFSIF